MTGDGMTLYFGCYGLQEEVACGSNYFPLPVEKLSWSCLILCMFYKLLPPQLISYQNDNEYHYIREMLRVLANLASCFCFSSKATTSNLFSFITTA